MAEKLAELDNALGEFNEVEKEVAKDDIEKLKENINACKKSDELNSVSSEINSIKSKICMAIVEKQKAEEKAHDESVELNSRKNHVDIEDIFAEMYMETPVDEKQEDLNIF